MSARRKRERRSAWAHFTLAAGPRPETPTNEQRALQRLKEKATRAPLNARQKEELARLQATVTT